jgi:uncharacterized protein (TIGR02246 family)
MSSPRTVFVMALLSAALAASFTARAEPRDDALRVVARWAAAFTASDVDAITALYAADATFLGTGSRTVVTTTAGIRSYFERGLLNNRPRSATLDEHVAVALSDTEVLVTGLDTVTSVRDGERISARGRVTFLLAKRGDDWRIVHFHRSALPN